MSHFAILILPATNRAYAGASAELMAAELEVFNDNLLGGRLGPPEQRLIGGVEYLTFESAELSKHDLGVLANLSSRYAIFEIEGDLLRPLEVQPLDQFDDDLLTIQKYPGKTNEHFTKLLLNVTIAASASGPEMLTRRLRVFDPLCGRGTTLNQALMYGYDASGIEIDGKDFEIYSGFLRTWLKRKRLKHRAELTPVRRNKKLVARRFEVNIGVDRQSYKSGDGIALNMVHADTVVSGEYFKPASFDVIVTDAPYGVQHGSKQVDTSLTRGPLELLHTAVPEWVELLRPGGAIGISWNTYGARREAVAEVLTDNGLELPASPAYEKFQHRVDQAITRDLIVARKP